MIKHRLYKNNKAFLIKQSAIISNYYGHFTDVHSYFTGAALSSSSPTEPASIFKKAADS